MLHLAPQVDESVMSKICDRQLFLERAGERHATLQGIDLTGTDF